MNDPKETRPVILLVEEETDVRQVLAGYLESAGFTVLEAEDANAALALIERRRDLNGLVTDARLPGQVEAQTLATRLRMLRPGAAVVLTSGHSDGLSGPVPEGVTFINKPNLLEQLGPTLHRLLAASARS